MSRPITGLVLSGGGARGAYEVGIMLGLTEVLGLGPNDPAPFQIFTGASVGAINTTFYASHAHRGDLGAAGLARVWQGLRLPVHLRVDPLRLSGARRLLAKLSGAPHLGTSLLDPAALDAVVRDSVPWRQLHRNVESGQVRALIIAALRVATGRTCMFHETAPGCEFRPSKDPRRIARPGPITADHVLASAAIPVVFPARKVDAGWYCDGGIRFNTPIAPAIRAGAERLVVISLMHQKQADEPHGDEQYPNPLFLLGKVLNALLLDPITYDLQILQRFNRVVEVLDDALDRVERGRIDAVVERARGQAYRRLETLVFHPSVDLGCVAGAHLRQRIGDMRLGRLAQWVLSRAAEPDATWEDDLASYLLFDGSFAERLIEIGRQDAHDRAAEIRDFFG